MTHENEPVDGEMDLLTLDGRAEETTAEIDLQGPIRKRYVCQSQPSTSLARLTNGLLGCAHSSSNR